MDSFFWGSRRSPRATGPSPRSVAATLTRLLYFTIPKGTVQGSQSTLALKRLPWTPVVKGNSALLYVGWAMQKICAWKYIFIFFMSTYFSLVDWFCEVFFLRFLWWGRVRKAVCSHLSSKRGVVSQDGRREGGPSHLVIHIYPLRLLLPLFWWLSDATLQLYEIFVWKHRLQKTHFQKK